MSRRRWDEAGAKSAWVEQKPRRRHHPFSCCCLFVFCIIAAAVVGALFTLGPILW